MPRRRASSQTSSKEDEIASRLSRQIAKALAPGHWQADVVPLPLYFDDPTQRPAIAVVATGKGRPCAASIEHARPELADVVRYLTDAVRHTADDDGPPSTIEVAHRVLVRPLQEALGDHGVTIVYRPVLAAVEATIRALFEVQLPGLFKEDQRLSSDPGTWAAWDFTPDLSRRLFVAAAQLYTSDMWDALGRKPFLLAQRGDGPTWKCDAVRTDEMRLFAMTALPAEPPEQGSPDERLMAQIQSAQEPAPTIMLRFISREDASPSMVAESDAAGWPVAHAHAYPHLIVEATPGGGIPAALALDLVGVVHGLTGFVDSHPVELARPGFHEKGVEWTDEDTATTFTYHGRYGDFMKSVGLPENLTLSNLSDFNLSDLFPPN